MLIANPLCNTAFKRLLRDPEVAKAIIETLLETEVVEIHLRESKHNKPMTEDDKRPRYMRVDYLVLIKTKNGESQKILIEMQKVSGSEDILRFREYLAISGYMPKPREDSPIPIVTIYFLGFKLRNVATPCLKVARQYIDMLNNEVLETKEKFVELLTHDSFIIQAPRINVGAAPKTKLENILSVFQQDGFTDSREDTIYYKYPVEAAYHKRMLDILNYIGTNPEERKKLDEEAYWERFSYHNSGKLAEALEALEALEEQKEENKKQKEEMLKKGAALAEQAALIEKLIAQVGKG